MGGRNTLVSPLERSATMDAAGYREVVELVRRVRHDASNPLTAALGNVQLLLEDPAVTDPAVREGLEVVESELRRLAEILKRLNEVRHEPESLDAG
jgi:signal transduction histidine kinase